MGPRPRKRATLPLDEAAVDSVIGTVLILGIMITVTGTMMAWGIPKLQQNEALASFTAAYNGFEALDAELEEVVSQGVGASRTVGFSSSAGAVTLAGAGGQWLMVWSSVGWVDLALRDMEEGGYNLTLLNYKHEFLKPPAGTTVELTWLDNGTQTSVELDRGAATLNTPLAPPMKGTLRAANATVLGGFFWAASNTINYRYPSAAGLYAVQIMNTGLVVREPGVAFRVANGPLIVRQQEDENNLRSLVLHTVNYNRSTTRFTSVTAGSFVLSMTNLAAEHYGPDTAYGLRLQFLGVGATAWQRYFIVNQDFTLADDELDVGWTQASPFKLIIVDTQLALNMDFR